MTYPSSDGGEQDRKIISELLVPRGSEFSRPLPADKFAPYLFPLGSTASLFVPMFFFISFMLTLPTGLPNT